MIPAKRSGMSGSRPVASMMVSANFTGSAVSRHTIGVDTWSRRPRATWMPSAVCGSTMTPRRSQQSRMVSTRSAWVERPDRNPCTADALGKAGSPDRVNPPCLTFTPNFSATRSASRSRRSKMKRSKFEAREMSIDGLDVARVSSEVRTR